MRWPIFVGDPTHLRGNLTVVSGFLTGSYTRDTMLRHSRDVDVFEVLDINYLWSSNGGNGYQNQDFGPANLLNRTSQLLVRRYLSTSIIETARRCGSSPRAALRN